MTELALIDSVMDEWMTSEDPTAVIRRTIRQARAQALEEAAQAAGDAQLPEGYQWGEEATEHFNFGKARAAATIRALKEKA